MINESRLVLKRSSFVKPIKIIKKSRFASSNSDIPESVTPLPKENSPNYRFYTHLDLENED